MHLHKRRNVLVNLCYRHTVYVCVGVYVASIDEVAALTWFTVIFSSIHEFVISLFYNAVTTQSSVSSYDRLSFKDTEKHFDT